MRLSIIFLLLAIISISFAATWYVNATLATTCNPSACSSDCANTIGSAVASSAAGDTIYVCRNGTNTIMSGAAVDISKSLNIYGNQSDVRVSVSAGSNIFRIREGSGVGAAGTNISNFTFGGGMSTGFAAINISVQNVTVYENDIVSSYYGILIKNSTLDRFSSIYNNRINTSVYGIYIESNSNNISNNTIYNNSLYGIYNNGSNNNFTSNRIYNNTVGIYLDNSASNNRVFSSNDIQNHTTGQAAGIFLQSVNAINYIYSNSVIQSNTFGVYLNLSTFTNISSNTFSSNTNSTYLINSYNNIIASNNIYNTTSYGVYVANGNGTNITSNIIQNATVGIYLNNASSANISHNNVTEAQRIEKYGIYLTTSNNSVLWNNSISNNSANAVYLSSSFNNTIYDNRAFNNSAQAFYLTSSDSNNLTNNSVSNNALQGFYLTSSSKHNFLISNNATSIYTLSGSGGVGFYSDSQNNTFRHNVAHNNTLDGFLLNAAHNNTLYNNTAYNNSEYGFYLSSANANNLTSNIAYNNSNHAFYISASDYNNLSSNTAYNHSGFIGFYLLSGSDYNRLFNNTAYTNSDGVYISSGANNSVYDNTLYNNSASGLTLNGGTFSNVTSNNLYNNTLYGLYFTSSNNNTISSNRVYNNSQYGFYFTGSSSNNLTNNNATNNLFAQYQFIISSTATFTGPNYAFQTPAGALDLNITGGSNVTTLVGSTYNNFSNENLTIFFHNAINVSIKFLANSSAGAAKSSCSTDFESCNLINFNGFNTVLNITSAAGSGRINLGIYFNASEFNDSMERTTVKIGKYSSGWLEVGRTVFDGSGSIRYDSITSFSLFGAVAFKAKLVPDKSSPGTPSLSIDFSHAAKLTCPGNLLELSTSPSVSGVLVSLILYEPYQGLKQQKSTNEGGKVTFDLTNEKEGKYQIESSKTGYQKPADVFFDFVKCATEQYNATQPSTNITVITEEPKNVTQSRNETQQNITYIEQITKEQILKSISDADNAITQAEKERKDVLAAKKKLQAASDAFNKGNYEKAANLAGEAWQLANNAKPLEIKPEPASQPKPEERTEEQPSGLDLWQLVLGLAAVGAIGFVIYKLFTKKGYGGFKK